MTLPALLLIAAFVQKADEAVDDQEIERRIVAEGERLAAAGGAPSAELLIEQLRRTSCEARLPEAAVGKPSEPPALYRSCRDSVVVIGGIYKCDRCPRWHATVGSAFAVGTPDLFATNYHVVDNAGVRLFLAMTRDGRFFPVQEVMAASRPADAALVRIPGPELRPLPLRAGAEVGSNVSIIAHPDSRFFSFTRGMVSREHRHAHDAAATTWLQVTADIGIGSSGGPVLDDRGNVVGMVARTHTVKSKPRGEGEVQMVFKDCVPAASILDLIKPPAGR